jgi:acetyl-CoA carboxylase beta subunit
MGFSGVDTMSFNPEQFNTSTILLNSSIVRTSVWIKDYTTKKVEDQVYSVFVIESGSARMQENLSAEDAQAMINILTQHIEHIKQAELELIAINSKAAA